MGHARSALACPRRPWARSFPPALSLRLCQAVQKRTQNHEWLDARGIQTFAYWDESDEDCERPPFWRFWRNLPPRGTIGIAKREEWLRAYQEINDFEAQLTGHGAILLKFWVHLGQDEQLRRFKEREKIPWKAHKITEEDWRNREKWDAYAEAVNDMVTHTSTEHAPWILLPGNDKKYARVKVIKTFCRRLKEVL